MEDVYFAVRHKSYRQFVTVNSFSCSTCCSNVTHDALGDWNPHFWFLHNSNTIQIVPNLGEGGGSSLELYS